MITTETPYKMAEIIRDTWPNLYRPTSNRPIIQRVRPKRMDEYWEVLDHLGKKIANTGTIDDAINLCQMRGQGHTYRKVKVYYGPSNYSNINNRQTTSWTTRTTCCKRRTTSNGSSAASVVT
jgi:hypothetical protein